MKKRKLKKFGMPSGYDKAIHACIIILMIFGSIMITSTVVGKITPDTQDVVVRTILKQIVFIVVSYVMMVMFAANFFKWKQHKQFHNVIRVLGIVLLVLLIACKLLPANRGAQRWIYLPFGVSIQPSEFAKTYLILLFGFTMNSFMSKKATLFQYIKEPLIFLLAGVALIAWQKDLGTVIVVLLLFICCFLVSSHYSVKPAQKVLKRIMIVAIVGVTFAMSNPGIDFLENTLHMEGFRLARFTSAQNPFEDGLSTGYNVQHSLYAIANGGLLGKGLGASEEKFGYLPEAESDFILAITIEELGLLGLTLLVTCYGIILYRLMYYAKRTISDGYRGILVGTFMYLSLHFIFNVGGISGFIPLTGIPLIFMSSGGSSIMSICVLLGVSQASIAMTKKQIKRNPDQLESIPLQ